MPKEQKSHKVKTMKQPDENKGGTITFLMHQEMVFVLLKDFIEWIDWEVYKLPNGVKK